MFCIKVVEKVDKKIKSCRYLMRPDKYGACTLRCGITKATETHSEYVIILASSRQQRLRERALLLRPYVYWMSFFLSCICQYSSLILSTCTVYILPVSCSCEYLERAAWRKGNSLRISMHVSRFEQDKKKDLACLRSLHFV